MEDIIGFEDQIGASFKRVIKRAAVLTPAGAAVTVAKKATAKKQPVRTQTPKGKAMDQAIAKRIATGKPIPPAIKKAIDKRQATGKPLPPAIKKAVAVKKPIAAKRSVAPAQVPFKRMNVQRAQVTAKQQAVATKIVKRREATGKPIPVRALTKVTAPTAVKAATPTQRSFMPVDLPYQSIDKKTKPMRIPATKFALPTSVDLVQPPVDAGTVDYYGK